jgi:hypothetical protein
MKKAIRTIQKMAMIFQMGLMIENLLNTKITSVKRIKNIVIRGLP